MIALCGTLMLNGLQRVGSGSPPSPGADADAAPVSWRQRLAWIGLEPGKEVSRKLLTELETAR
jgi:hypothetical protein